MHHGAYMYFYLYLYARFYDSILFLRVPQSELYVYVYLNHRKIDGASRIAIFLFECQCRNDK